MTILQTHLVNGMDKDELTSLALNIGVSVQHLSSDKKFLIREIQRARGQEPCYLTDLRYSCNASCDWSNECKKLTAAWLR